MLKFRSDAVIRQVERAISDPDLTVLVGELIHVHETLASLLLVRATERVFNALVVAMGLDEDAIQLAFVCPDLDDDDAEGQDDEVSVEVEGQDDEVDADVEGQDDEVTPAVHTRKGEPLDW